MLKSINENLVMMIAMRPIFLAILLLWPFLGLGTATTATTFELHVDGRATTLGAGALSGALEGPASLADISMGVATDTLHSYCNLTHSRPSLEKMTIDDREQHCFPHSGGRGACCFVNYHHARNDGLFTLQVVIHVSNDFYTRIDVSLTASVDDNVIRQSLVQALPKIRERLTDAKNGDDSSVWFINHRPNAVQIDLTQTHLDAQDDRDKKAASVESVILGNSGMRNRVQLEHTFVDFPNASQSLLELWEYKDLDLKDPVKSLFIDGKLQTTTSPAGTAHAEALVHPAMIAHSIPKDVIIISRTPLAVVREVLKHKSVERVTVFGTDMTALDIVMRSMPVHNDCSFLKTDDPNCVSQAAVEIVDQVEVKEWLSSCRKDVSDNQDSATCYYDVVLLDVPIGRHEWLSPDFHDDLQWLCKEDTVIMVSSGSHPQLSDVTGEIGMNARDMLLYNASRKQSHGGIGYPTVLVFDEPLAHPLSSTYITLFDSIEEQTYSRFVRKNSPAIDIDIVNRLHPTISSPPTLVYDGSTHKGYMTTSKAWENWFCRTSPWNDLSVCEFASNWMDPDYHHFSIEVRNDQVKGRTVYATEDIPKGHFVNPKDAALSWRLEKDVFDALVQFVKDYPEAEMYKNLLDFLQAYGFTQQGIGIDGFGVSVASISTFINHACSKDDERITGLSIVDDDGEEAAFSPPYARRAEVIEQVTVATQDIHIGEEILQDYSMFRPESDKAYKEYLEQMCATGVGLVPRDSDESRSTCNL